MDKSRTSLLDYEQKHIYLKDEDKKSKCTKKCVVNRNLEFQDHKNCLEAAQIEIKSTI